MDLGQLLLVRMESGLVLSGTSVPVATFDYRRVAVSHKSQHSVCSVTGSLHCLVLSSYDFIVARYIIIIIRIIAIVVIVVVVIIIINAPDCFKKCFKVFIPLPAFPCFSILSLLRF